MQIFSLRKKNDKFTRVDIGLKLAYVKKTFVTIIIFLEQFLDWN